MTTVEFTRLLDTLIRQTMKREDTLARKTRLEIIEEYKYLVSEVEAEWHVHAPADADAERNDL